MMANLLVASYVRGAVRDALDEGVRAAAVVNGTPAVCTERARTALTQLVGGSAVVVDELRCDDDGDWVVARARVRLRVLGDWRLAVTARARRG